MEKRSNFCPVCKSSNSNKINKSSKAKCVECGFVISKSNDQYASDKGITRTFHMRKSLVEALEKEAASRGVSASLLMNQIVDNAVSLIWPSDKTGALVLSRDIVKSMLNLLPAEEVSKIGALTAQKHKSTVMVLLRTQQNFESVLNLLDVTYGDNSRWFKLSHNFEGRDHRIFLNHTLGIKWSCFLEGYMRSFFMAMLDGQVKSSYMENSVVLEYRA